MKLSPCHISNELQPFILHISHLGLGHQQPSVQCKSNDVCGDPACVLLRLQSQDDLVVGVGNEFEGGEAVGGVKRSDALRGHMSEVGGARQEEVGGSALIGRLLVVLVAGTAR